MREPFSTDPRIDLAAHILDVLCQILAGGAMLTGALLLLANLLGIAPR